MTVRSGPKGSVVVDTKEMKVDDGPACCECVWMQAFASRIRKAFQNSGVHADSFNPCFPHLGQHENVKLFS